MTREEVAKQVVPPPMPRFREETMCGFPFAQHYPEGFGMRWQAFNPTHPAAHAQDREPSPCWVRDLDPKPVSREGEGHFSHIPEAPEGA